ncbi:glycosyltransferase family 2 protein [Puniceicoccaceae bacterium K14]|nr:glycosyltransferase family 2 protein [Puniceicoccaceae bacterium K14]
MSSDASKVELSLAIPCYNEEAVLDIFVARIREILDPLNLPYELVFVDDGSSDNTLEKLKGFRSNDRRIKILAFSRNFGKEPALSAALQHCTGNAIVPIDADLQEPPELIPEMLKLWREGYEVVTAQRSSRDSDSFTKRFTAQWFYRVFNMISSTRLPYDTGDYRLMDRKVVEAFKGISERNRFMKGIFAWLGFKQTSVTFKREERSAGNSKFGFKKLLGFAIRSIFAFSSQPLRFLSYMGVLFSVAAFSYASFLLIRTLAFGRDVPGYASLMVAILFMGGVQLIGLGVLGEYLGHIYDEVKRRPLFIIRESHGIETHLK